LSIYDPSYRPLAKKVAYGILDYGISPQGIPEGDMYPDGSHSRTVCGLPSNGGDNGTVAITVIGLLRTYEATGDKTFLNESKRILLTVWNKERTKYNLVPSVFDSESLVIVTRYAQMYATGELLRAYIYCYYLTGDQRIKDVIAAYSHAAYSYYWTSAKNGHGYFMYRVDALTGKPSSLLLETNWHKLDMSLIYAGEITGRDYKDRVYRDMLTYWLGDGLVYKNQLFRHGTKRDGSPAKNTQSLLDASLRSANYVMLRMLNDGALNLTAQDWNYKVWGHINALRSSHFQSYGYHSNVDVVTLQPDPKYFGLTVEPACGEFASLVTLMFRTTPNVRMAWESFPNGYSTLEPFITAHSADDVGFMSGVFMDLAHREVAFERVTSHGSGKIVCTDAIAEVIEDGRWHANWSGNTVFTSNGNHDYIIIFKGGSYIPPVYPKASKG
jgi:hypothetical protein